MTRRIEWYHFQVNPREKKIFDTSREFPRGEVVGPKIRSEMALSERFFDHFWFYSLSEQARRADYVHLFSFPVRHRSRPKSTKM